MRILAFDTATGATTVALVDAAAGIELEVRHDPPSGERPGHTTQLLPLIAAALEGGGGGWEAVDLIAVGVGPGTFTGLRIGIATARALARAREIPLVGVSSLHALALGATEEAGSGAVLAVIDARRGEAFAAAWQEGERVLDPSALRPEALAVAAERLAVTSRRPALAVGDGALRFRERLETAGAEVPSADSSLHRISAINHCRLAAGLRATSPAEVEPAYLRAPDAEIAYRERKRGPK
ncbi:MAG: tRNA threonylcarbamoyladenosine biosynthesis protein TsaB [Solirubrobacteraceae bacterium]|nr:tRNA threonylcarbamoyladenosine biosynthesis protein TsaB [Solirubrobacteraceae bacterium]